MDLDWTETRIFNSSSDAAFMCVEDDEEMCLASCDRCI